MWYHLVNHIRREFAHTLAYSRFCISCSKRAWSGSRGHASSRDKIDGVKPLVVDILIFWSKRWCFLGKSSAIEEAAACNSRIPCKILKITHNYQMFLFYYHFLVHFLIISRSTELKFDYIDIFGVRGEVLWGVLPAVEEDIVWNRGMPCKIFISIIKLYIFCFLFYVFCFYIKSV